MSTGSDEEGYSFRQHLHLELDEYDAAIRRFIPGYDEMLGRAAEEVLRRGPGRVLDLGAGTGAMILALVTRSPTVSVEALDLDPEMLELARERLQEWGGRVGYRKGSFRGDLPSADAVTASLALHHIPTLDAKTAVYRNIHRALPEGGVFVSADVTLPSHPSLRGAAYQAWAHHLVENGIPLGRAFEHFREWADEDTYFAAEQELAALRSVGFQAEVAWRNRVSTVVVGVKTVF